MSSASLSSGTRLRMKLRNRSRSRPTASDMRRSCSFVPITLNVWFIYTCRRTSGRNIVWFASSYIDVGGVQGMGFIRLVLLAMELNYFQWIVVLSVVKDPGDTEVL